MVVNDRGTTRLERKRERGIERDTETHRQKESKRESDNRER
jgi:hypothetical protein